MTFVRPRHGPYSLLLGLPPKPAPPRGRAVLDRFSPRPPGESSYEVFHRLLDNEVARYDPDIAGDRYGERPVERPLPVEGEGLVAALAWGTPKDAWFALVLSEERALTIPVSFRGLLVACRGDVLCEFVSLGDVSVQLRWSARSLKLATARVASPLTDAEWPRELERYGAGEPSAAVVRASFFELVGGLPGRAPRGD